MACVESTECIGFFFLHQLLFLVALNANHNSDPTEGNTC